MSLVVLVWRSRAWYTSTLHHTPQPRTQSRQYSSHHAHPTQYARLFRTTTPSQVPPPQPARALSSAPAPLPFPALPLPHPPYPHRSTFYSDLLLFDTTTSKWTQLFASIPNFKPRANHAAVLIGAEATDAHTGHHHTGTELASGRQAHTQGQAGVDAKGKGQGKVPGNGQLKGQLWVIGGSDNEGVFTEAHVLDLATHTWHRPQLRCVPQGVLLRDALRWVLGDGHAYGAVAQGPAQERLTRRVWGFVRRRALACRWGLGRGAIAVHDGRQEPACAGRCSK